MLFVGVSSLTSIREQSRKLYKGGIDVSLDSRWRSVGGFGVHDIGYRLEDLTAQLTGDYLSAYCLRGQLYYGQEY